LEKREQFAISLRKQKKAEILSSKRLKLSLKRNTEAREPLNQVCSNLLYEGVTLETLTNLRLLISDREYLTENRHHIQSSSLFGQTVSHLLTWPVTAECVSEYAWVMTNAPLLQTESDLKLCSTQAVRVLCSLYSGVEPHPDLISAIANFTVVPESL
jgi:hypothetical protein